MGHLASLLIIVALLSASVLAGCLSSTPSTVSVIEIRTQSTWSPYSAPPPDGWAANVTTDPEDLQACSSYQLVNSTLVVAGDARVADGDFIIIGEAFGHLPVRGGNQRSSVVEGPSYAVHAILDPDLVLYRIAADGSISDVDASNYDRVSGITNDPATYLRFAYPVTEPNTGVTVEWAESHQITTYPDVQLEHQADAEPRCPTLAG